jgi:hypothetical protein
MKLILLLLLLGDLRTMDSSKVSVIESSNPAVPKRSLHLHSTNSTKKSDCYSPQTTSSLPSVLVVTDSQAQESGLYLQLNDILSKSFNVMAGGGPGTCLTRTEGGCAGSSALNAVQGNCLGGILLWVGANDVKIANGAGAGFEGYMQSFITGAREACETKFVIVQSPLHGGPPPPGWDPEWPAEKEDDMNVALAAGCQWASEQADVKAVCNTNSFFKVDDFQPPKGRPVHFGPGASGTEAFRDAIVNAAKEQFR